MSIQPPSEWSEAAPFTWSFVQYTDCTTVQGCSAGLEAEEPSSCENSEAQDMELEQAPGKVIGNGTRFLEERSRMEKERGVPSTGRAFPRSLSRNLT